MAGYEQLHPLNLYVLTARKTQYDNVKLHSSSQLVTNIVSVAKQAVY